MARTTYMPAIWYLICRLAVAVEFVLLLCFTFFVCVVILLPLEPRHVADFRLFQLPSILLYIRAGQCSL